MQPPMQVLPPIYRKVIVMDLNTGATSGGSTFDYSAQQYSYQTPVTQTTTTTTSTYTTGGDFGATYSTGADLSSFATGDTSSLLLVLIYLLSVLPQLNLMESQLESNQFLNY